MAGLAKKSKANGNGANGKTSGANLGFEATLWQAADKLRANMDAVEYKRVVPGLIFLQYISDSFEEMHTRLLAGEEPYAGADPEDPDEYRPCRGRSTEESVPKGERAACLANARSGDRSRRA